MEKAEREKLLHVILGIAPIPTGLWHKIESLFADYDALEASYLTVVQDRDRIESVAEDFQAKAAELERDRARLDWLESTNGVDLEYEGAPFHHWWLSNTDEPETRSTLREAIDAAMQRAAREEG